MSCTRIYVESTETLKGQGRKKEASETLKGVILEHTRK